MTSDLSLVALFHPAEAGWEQLGTQPVAASTFTTFLIGWVVLVSVLNLVKDYSFMGLCILAAKNLFRRCASVPRDPLTRRYCAKNHVVETG
jgi:hypothetical protein